LLMIALSAINFIIYHHIVALIFLFQTAFFLHWCTC
jgi:hypothetical protein